MISSPPASPRPTASSPAGERSPIASGRVRIGRVIVVADLAAARLEDADPDRRRQRPGQVGQVGEADATGSTCRRRRSPARRDPGVSPAIFLVARPKLKPGSFGNGLSSKAIVACACDRRARRPARRSNNSPPPRPETVPAGGSAGRRPTARPSAVGGTKSSTRNSMLPIAARLRIELQFGPPRADPGVARQRIGHGIGAELVAGQLAALDLDPIRPHAAARSAASPLPRQPCRRAPAPSDAPLRRGGRCRGRCRDRRRPGRAGGRPLTPRSDRSKAARPTSRKLKSPPAPLAGP